MNARLLACYDQLDVARYRDQSTRELEQANAALVLLNQNLALRLRESQADGGRLRERLSAVDEPVRYANDSSAQRASMSRSRPIMGAQRFQPTQQDTSADEGEPSSDTPTEVEYAQQPRHRPSNMRRSSSDHRLRTRTIVLELTNELEAVRKRSELAEAKSQDSLALLQAHLESRDRELSSLYEQMDRFFSLEGLPGAQAMVAEAKEKADPTGEERADENTSARILSELNEQVSQMRLDLARLSVERDNLLIANSVPAIGNATGGGAQQQDTGLSSQLVQAQAEVRSLRLQLQDQEASFDTLASRVSGKLSAQKADLSHAQDEVEGLHRALHDMEQVAAQANSALERERRRRELAEESLLQREGSVTENALAGHAQRPRSAGAGNSDPPSGLVLQQRHRRISSASSQF